MVTTSVVTLTAELIHYCVVNSRVSGGACVQTLLEGHKLGPSLFAMPSLFQCFPPSVVAR